MAGCVTHKLSIMGVEVHGLCVSLWRGMDFIRWYMGGHAIRAWRVWGFESGKKNWHVEKIVYDSWAQRFLTFEPRTDLMIKISRYTNRQKAIKKKTKHILQWKTFQFSWKMNMVMVWQTGCVVWMATWGYTNELCVFCHLVEFKNIQTTTSNSVNV